MHCYICDRPVTPAETKFNKQTGMFDPVCGTCEDIIFETNRDFGDDSYDSAIEEILDDS